MPHVILLRIGFPQQRGQEDTGGKGVGSLASGALVFLSTAYLPATRLDLSDCWLLPIALMAWTVNR